jgi:hypothetical protein
MNIIDYYYESRNLNVEFSTIDDGDKFYRTLNLSFDDIQYYSPTIIIEKDLYDIDEDFIIDLLNQYLKENDLPEEESL